MIQRLRVKFITASMLSLVLVLLVILGGVNAMSYRKIVQDAGHILELLSENRGAFPKALPPDGETGKPDRPLPPGNGLSPEAPFESRFFSVLLDGEGQVLQSDTGQIAAVDDQSAGEMAQAVWETGHTGGFWEDYRYVRVAENGRPLYFFGLRAEPLQLSDDPARQRPGGSVGPAGRLSASAGPVQADRPPGGGEL